MGMRAITILTIALLATSIVPLGFNQNAYASHFLIDDFSAAGAPGKVTGFLNRARGPSLSHASMLANRFRQANPSPVI